MQHVDGTFRQYHTTPSSGHPTSSDPISSLLHFPSPSYSRNPQFLLIPFRLAAFRFISRAPFTRILWFLLLLFGTGMHSAPLLLVSLFYLGPTPYVYRLSLVSFCCSHHCLQPSDHFTNTQLEYWTISHY